MDVLLIITLIGGGSPQHAYYIRNSSVYHSSFLLPSQVPRRRSLLPSHLHSVMGSANLRLARGDIPAAIELCMEVVRQGTYLCMRKDCCTVRHVCILFIAPESPEPYLALATAYEETGEKDKLLQVSV